MLAGQVEHGFMCSECGSDALSPCTWMAYQCKRCSNVEFAPPSVCPAYLARNLAQLVLDHANEVEVRRAAESLMATLQR